jgi:hypothetical protein
MEVALPIYDIYMINFDNQHIIMQISETTLPFFLKKDQYGDICANARRQHEINGRCYIYLLLMSCLMRMDLIPQNGL